LADLDRHAEDLRVGLGILGSRSQRLRVSGQRAVDIENQLRSDLSGVRDADLAEVALDLARSDQILQLAQASGARLIQTSLLNFLG
jgi:flagellin-like hook-associated protein FlgL